jgi:hypothetical protein
MLKIDSGLAVLGLALIIAGNLLQRSSAIFQSRKLINSWIRGLSSLRRKRVSDSSKERMVLIVAVRMLLSSSRILLSLALVASPLVLMLILDQIFDLDVIFHLFNTKSRMLILGAVVLVLGFRYVRS